MARWDAGAGGAGTEDVLLGGGVVGPGEHLAHIELGEELRPREQRLWGRDRGEIVRDMRRGRAEAKVAAGAHASCVRA